MSNGAKIIAGLRDAIAQAKGASACLWCRGPFVAGRLRGSPQRFCSADCRHGFRTAAAQWALRALDLGLISVETLKTHQRGARASGEAL
jgi:hypothetical protein